MSDTQPKLTLQTTGQSLVATLEIIYLQKTLEGLPADRKYAIDAGAHRGDVTAALADLGFHVLAIEPQAPIAEQLKQRFSALLDSDMVRVECCGASDRRGTGTLYVGSASTVSTLEESWTKVAFPEEFAAPRKIDIPVYPLAELALANGFNKPGFVKIDVEGHELRALGGMFDAAFKADPPLVIMFEANQRFPETAQQCLALLNSRGYDRFDIFIRDGAAPISAHRFSGSSLPPAWFVCEEKYFFANIIAYHSTLPAASIPADPVAFVCEFQMLEGRRLLNETLDLEIRHPFPVQPIWDEARLKLRDYILNEDWRGFLQNQVCRFMFYRGRWGPTQDKEFEILSASEFGRRMLNRVRDPQLGSPRPSGVLPNLSTNMLGMLYYMLRVHETAPIDPALESVATPSARRSATVVRDLPERVVEVGGGFGAFAYVYAQCNPDASYVIVDLPEMLALQHYYLTLALPGYRIVCARRPTDVKPAPRQILLLPTSLIDPGTVKADLFFSTFGFSELPRPLQSQIESSDYFGARQIFLAGQMASEIPQAQLVDHTQVIGAAMERFKNVIVERFHIGDNYLLIGNKSAPTATASVA